MSESLSPDLSKSGFLYRFEVFLPVTSNAGALIDPEKFDGLTLELSEKFGGISFDYPYGGSGGVNGMWYSSVTHIFHRDNNAFIMVLTKAENGAIKFFQDNLKKWQKKFGQEKILIIFHKVQSF